MKFVVTVASCKFISVRSTTSGESWFSSSSSSKSFWADVMSLANPSHFLFTVSSRRGLPAPVFEQVVEQGPPHMRTYVWQCQFHGYTAQGQGRTKKEAKAAAARAIQVR